MDQLPTTTYAVLGMLSFSPMSGYDLVRYADRSIAHFWAISKSQVYAELSRLEDLGYVRGTDVSQEKLPDKRTYELTAAGSAALDEWVADGRYERPRARNGLLLKVFFAHRMSPERFREFLGKVRSDAERYRDQLQEIVDVLSGPPETFFVRATALAGVYDTEAVVSWAREIEQTLPSQRRKPVPREVIEEKTHEFFRATPERRDKKTRKAV